MTAPAPHAEYVALRDAVAKLHHPVEMKVLATACWQEDCDHDDSDGCEAACVPTMCCAHCTSLREETAFHEEADYAVQPWPCPTATAALIDGTLRCRASFSGECLARTDGHGGECPSGECRMADHSDGSGGAE